MNQGLAPFEGLNDLTQVLQIGLEKSAELILLPGLRAIDVSDGIALSFQMFNDVLPKNSAAAGYRDFHGWAISVDAANATWVLPIIT